MNLRELSEKLGLSQTTISRALNDYPEVSEKTRERVKQAARTFGYSPNTRAKSLATGRTMSIGHVIPVSTKAEMVNVVFSDFIAGAGEAYARHGYDMRMSVVSDDQEANAYTEMARNGTVDGVILHGPFQGDPRIGLLSELGIPFVSHGRATGIDLPYSWLDVNNRTAFRQATNHLLDLGHSRIALINGHEHLSFAQRRRQGFVDAMDAHGAPVDDALMYSSDMTEPMGYEAAKQMLRADAPTGFVVSSSVMALGVQRAVSDHGLKLGHDVSLICFDDQLAYLPNGGDNPVFTAVRSSVKSAGTRCAEMLLELISGRATGPLQELWEVELVAGKSTGPPKRK